MVRRRNLVFVASLLVLTACGGDKNPAGPGGGGNSPFSATLDGSAWASAGAAAAANATSNGIFAIVGSPLTSGAATIGLTLYNMSAPGTFPLGVGPTVRGGTVAVTQDGKAWTSPLSGSAGSVTITAISSTHITGTFNAVVAGITGGATGNRTLTNGAFDIPVTASGTVTVPDYAWSSFSGSLNGAAWTAANVVLVSPPSSGTLMGGFSNDAWTVTLILSGWTGPGTYTFGTGVSRYVQLSKLGSPQAWGGPGAGQATGTVTITSSTATRVIGNLTGTLKAVAGSGAAGDVPLSGTFQLGVPPGT